jgi:cytoskeletal protein RodZ
MHDIGRLLREKRLACGLEISDVAKRTCINGRYLRAMEEGRFQIIPRFFDKGYLKIYAHILDIDAISLLALYEQRKKESSEPQQHFSAAR